jgi:hypothetical protein
MLKNPLEGGATGSLGSEGFGSLVTLDRNWLMLVDPGEESTAL